MIWARHMPARRLTVLAGAILVIASCAARRPVLYPNEKLNQAGAGGADRDIAECMQLAEAYVSTGAGRAGGVARDTAIGGGTGAAIGAAGGAVYSDAGRGAAAGAATGATAGLLHGLFSMGEPDPLYQSYIDNCLADRGYRVLGWR